MANVSTARKVGIAARIAGQQVRRSRTYGAIVGAARATLGHFQLWLEITGFVFVVFAVVGGVALVRESVAYHAGKGTSGRVAAATAFTLVFAWFGASSFWRVRSKK